MGLILHIIILLILIIFLRNVFKQSKLLMLILIILLPLYVYTAHLIFPYTEIAFGRMTKIQLIYIHRLSLSYQGAQFLAYLTYFVICWVVIGVTEFISFKIGLKFLSKHKKKD